MMYQVVPLDQTEQDRPPVGAPSASPIFAGLALLGAVGLGLWAGRLSPKKSHRLNLAVLTGTSAALVGYGLWRYHA